MTHHDLQLIRQAEGHAEDPPPRRHWLWTVNRALAVVALLMAVAIVAAHVWLGRW